MNWLKSNPVFAGVAPACFAAEPAVRPAGGLSVRAGEAVLPDRTGVVGFGDGPDAVVLLVRALEDVTGVRDGDDDVVVLRAGAGVVVGRAELVVAPRLVVVGFDVLALDDDVVADDDDVVGAIASYDSLSNSKKPIRLPATPTKL